MEKHKPTIIPPGSVIGIIGGGQLARMTALSAANMGYKTHVYAPKHHSEPAMQVVDYITIADYEDVDRLNHFAKQVDVVTLEFENIPHASLNYIQDTLQVELCPGWEALYYTQNRVREKDFISSLGIETAAYQGIKTMAGLKDAVAQIGRPCILKTNEMGYDGKGQYRITQDTNLDALCSSLEQYDHTHGWIIEAFVPFDKEISTVIARAKDGTAECFAVAENIHEDGILKRSIAPANINQAMADLAHRHTKDIAAKLNYIGVMAVEYFVVGNDIILANEIAPRPHNSGHWTMDACITSQFEQHVRAVCGLPLGNVEMLCPVEMHNLIGSDVDSWYDYLSAGGNQKLHLYGKSEVRPGRKMGHLNQLKRYSKSLLKKGYLL